MYFSFFKLKKWGKKTAAARRHNCAVLPYNVSSSIKRNYSPSNSGLMITKSYCLWQFAAAMKA